jgi:hypothetical protein
MDNTSGTGLRLISFGMIPSQLKVEADLKLPDGGGARSLSQLKIMNNTITCLQFDLYPNDPDKVLLPYKCFDLMGGSDTGAYV